MVEMKDRKFKKTVNDLEKIRGRHTELVTVYVPAGSNLGTVVDQLRTEQSTAQNIRANR